VVGPLVHEHCFKTTIIQSYTQIEESKHQVLAQKTNYSSYSFFWNNSYGRYYHLILFSTKTRSRQGSCTDFYGWTGCLYIQLSPVLVSNLHVEICTKIQHIQILNMHIKMCTRYFSTSSGFKYKDKNYISHIWNYSVLQYTCKNEHMIHFNI
jgi:hypothetical protein